jgi:hypothetical protein
MWALVAAAGALLAGADAQTYTASGAGTGACRDLTFGADSDEYGVGMQAPTGLSAAELQAACSLVGAPCDAVDHNPSGSGGAGWGAIWVTESATWQASTATLAAAGVANADGWSRFSGNGGSVTGGSTCCTSGNTCYMHTPPQPAAPVVRTEPVPTDGNTQRVKLGDGIGCAAGFSADTQLGLDCRCPEAYTHTGSLADLYADCDCFRTCRRT